MSLSGIWSGNFHQLRNSFGSTFGCKLFRVQTTVISERPVGSRRCKLQPIIRKVGGRYQKPESNKPSSDDLKLLGGSVRSSTSLSINKSDDDFKNIHYYNIQQKIVEANAVEWPAVVLVFDIETTGFGPKGRIIEFAIRDLFGGKNSTFQTLVNPQKVVLNSDVHGITTRMVNRPEVPRMEDFIPILIKFVRSRQIPGKPVILVAHNGRRFDVPFLVNEFRRCAMEVPSDWLFLDTLYLARRLVKPDGTKLPSVSLNALREFFEIVLDGQAHRAMHDVMVLSLVLQHISFRLKISVAEFMPETFRASDVM
uniref:DNA polymerase III polC-type n=1 Tax=Anthurium amnicola TaxID=1678845 RepID=A0A1D1YU06_9ARAE